jgi:signal transduction histidine kinase
MAGESDKLVMPRRRKRERLRAAVDQLPLRMKTMLVGILSFLVIAFVVAISTAFLVNGMKNRLVDEAREQVRLVAEESSQEIARILEQRELKNLAEVARDDAVLQAQMKIMTREGGVVMVAMVDSEGHALYQLYGENQIPRQTMMREGDSLSGMVPNTDDLTFELKVLEMPAGVTTDRVPIRSGEDVVGFLEYGVSPDAVLGSLDPMSRMITRSLVWMVAIIVVCLGAAILLLHFVANRHLVLNRRHAEAQHLATIGTLASGLAHEIRNPLHAMNLHLDAVREELEEPQDESPERAARIVAGIQRQIESLSSTLTNFMNYAIPMELEREALRLSPITSEVTSLLEPEFKSRGVEISRDIPEDAYIMADPTAVRQVLTNILLNGAQALEKADLRRLTIRATRQDAARWVVLVEDTGPGIPAELADAIFDVFVSGRKGGTGFGLPIARRVMEAHGGTLTAENIADGGARFILTFPAAEKPATAPATTAAMVRDNPATS